MINNAVCRLNNFYEWKLLDPGDSSFEEPSEVWGGPVWAVDCDILKEGWQQWGR